MNPAVKSSSAIVAIASALVGLGLVAPERYYGLVQEDGIVEWATFWALSIAAAGFARIAARTRGWAGAAPALVAIGCGFLAGEEISWGQRVLGYRPPDLFLGSNVQQEANLHNLVGADVRQVALVAALLTLGGVLPLALRSRRVGRIAARLGVPSPLPVVPPLLGALALQIFYPVEFTGEVVELLVGMALAGLAAEWAAVRWRTSGVTRAAWGLLLPLGLGAISSTALAWRSGSPTDVAQAQREVYALATDLLLTAEATGRAPTGCGTHTRLHSVANTPNPGAVRWTRFEESFTADAERQRYLLDPWNSSYWVRDHCGAGERSVFVYSLGPNRRRDSSESSLGGDDIGAYLVKPRPAQR